MELSVMEGSTAMRLIDADALAEIFANRMELIAERYGIDSSEAGILSGAYKLLESMPTITTDQHWIPCSERLPDKPNIYAVTDHNGKVARYVFYDNESSREYWRRCAKAWMPLPDPYKEQQP